jgi:demethylmenaquinone methyltransferase/2-methoxy-6-polyprenyl-1,4-benzoquinol methylase
MQMALVRRLRYGPPTMTGKPAIDAAKRSPQRGEPDAGRRSFGYRDVDDTAHQDLVNDVFSKVAARYDVMNDLMSGGMHRLWKDAMVDWLAPPHASRAFEVIDVAGGTGDIAFRIARTAPASQIAVCDINGDMILEGKRRARKQAVAERVSFNVCNAEQLAFPDRRFDAYTIAFGIRNVTHIEAALAEAYRVLKPGGRFLCMEFAQVQLPGLDRLYDAYSMTAIPAIGKVVTGDGAPYRYLVESIRKFPSQEMFKRMIEAAGFGRVQYRDLSGGIVAMHSAWRL